MIRFGRQFNATYLPSLDELAFFLERRCLSIKFTEPKEKQTFSLTSQLISSPMSQTTPDHLYYNTIYVATNRSTSKVCELCKAQQFHNPFVWTQFKEIDFINFKLILSFCFILQFFATDKIQGLIATKEFDE